MYWITELTYACLVLTPATYDPAGVEIECSPLTHEGSCQIIPYLGTPDLNDLIAHWRDSVDLCPVFYFRRELLRFLGGRQFAFFQYMFSTDSTFVL